MKKHCKAAVILWVFSIQVCMSQSEHTADSFINKATSFFSSDFDSCKYYLKNALSLLTRDSGLNDIVFCYNSLAAIAYYENQLDEFMHYGYLAYANGKELPKVNNEVITAITNYGAIQSTKGDSEKAINLYEEALEYAYLDSTTDLRTLASILNILGTEYSLNSDFYKAIGFYQRSIGIRQDSLGVVNDNLATLYLDLGKIYEKIGNYQLSFSYLFLSKSVLLELDKGDYVNDQITIVYQELARNLLKREELDSAFVYLEKAIGNQKKFNTIYEYVNYEILGEYYRKRKEFYLSRKNFKKAYEIALGSKNAINVTSTARQYTNLANLEYELQNYQEALDNYQKALTHLFYNFEEEGDYPNPSSLQVARPLDGIQGLHNKAKTLYHLYLENQNLEDLELSLSTYQLAAQLIKKARQDIMTSGSKQLLAGEVLPVYEGAIQTALKLQEITGDKNYLEQAFQFAESNKAILLLESINEQVAKNYGGIPDSLQEKERDLRIDIAFYEKTINKEKQKGEEGDVEKIDEWEKVLFDLRQDYADLVDLLEKEYPRYYEFKYDTRLAQVADIQTQLLDRKSALIEYFVGEEQLFLFRITKTDLQVFAIPKTESYTKEVQELLDAINTPVTNATAIDSFAAVSQAVYEKYLSPALKGLSSTVDRLIVIPDDRLTYLPFEVLLEQPLQEAGDGSGLAQLPYLLKHYRLNYSYSSTLLLNSLNEEREEAPKSMLAMAPSFNSPLASTNRNCTPEQLYSLQCSPFEVETIGNKLNGKYIVGKEAVRDHFIREASQYRILHLATHSCSDQENPMMSKIYFADGDLSNYELYNMELGADLAVLSSCNSGSGKLVRGEGVMSLSKGFIHAGCPSTVISLWSVDDCATSDIMIRFYEQLGRGQSKDGALQNAKLNYLETVDKLHQHPYYWAAFVQMGNFDPLQQKGWPRAYYLVLGLILVAGGVFWNRSRRRAAA